MHRCCHSLISAAVAASAAATCLGWDRIQLQHNSSTSDCFNVGQMSRFAPPPSPPRPAPPPMAHPPPPPPRRWSRTPAADRRRLAPLLAEARRRLLLPPLQSDAAEVDIDAVLAPVRDALAEARTRDGLSDAELHRLSASAHSAAAADCIAAGRRSAAEKLLRAELQVRILS
uniref:DUF4168 domain-containing protein n=1 Tax=Macrostomum lignano TaxID=282301 RepID=A0A1I8F7E5_9PLAT